MDACIDGVLNGNLCYRASDADWPWPPGLSEVEWGLVIVEWRQQMT